jgi:hypothetical protein
MSATALGLTLFEQWEAEFRPLLGDTARWKAFSYIVRDQLERPYPVILETGTLRQPGNWAGDGQSTKLWDWIVSHKGTAFSVDSNAMAWGISQKHCPKVSVQLADSIEFLRHACTEKLFPITLLYLDSYDYSPGQELASAMHQVGELAAIWERLPLGCLIASDDNHSKDEGKGALIRRLLHILHIEPVIDSYVVVWEKP